MPPLVSALVNTYNHQRFIAQAIQSVLDQDFPADQMEIIVVDDGSTDHTSEIIRPFLPRIRYIHKENGGQVSAFNVGVAESRGEILAFLDGDDWWAPKKISSVVAAFEKNPSIGSVGHAYYEVDENGCILGTMSPTSNTMGLKDFHIAQISYSLRVFLGTSRFAIRRSVLEKTLPVPAELPFFDNFVFSQAAAISGAILLDEPLCYYRLHSRNLYSAGSSSNHGGQRVLWTRYRLLCSLLQYLPRRLSALGIPEENIAAFLGADYLDAERLRLVLTGGKRLDTFRVERAVFRFEYRDPDLGFRLFKSLVLLLTLLVPPRAFYRLREWYAARNLRSFREYIGDSAHAAPLVERRSVELANKSAHSRDAHETLQ